MKGYNQIRIKDFIAYRVDLRDFCFVLEYKLGSQYRYAFLKGSTPSEKSMSLVEIAKRRDELGELVYQLVKYWLERLNGNPRVLRSEKIHEELFVYHQELLDEGDKNKANQTLNLILVVVPNFEAIPAKGDETKLFPKFVTDGESYKEVESEPFTIFISYSQKDEKEREELLKHLKVIQLSYPIDLWSDDRIGAGVEWEKAIDAALSKARIAVLLITANFLTSEFIMQKEVPKLLKRRDKEDIIIFPIIARECAWKTVDWLKRILVRPKQGRPVWSDGGSHVDEDLTAIAEEIAELVKRKG